MLGPNKNRSHANALKTKEKPWTKTWTKTPFWSGVWSAWSSLVQTGPKIQNYMKMKHKKRTKLGLKSDCAQSWTATLGPLGPGAGVVTK